MSMMLCLKDHNLILFLYFYKMFRPALGSTWPSVQWVLGALSLRVEWPGHEADQSPPASAKFKNDQSALLYPIRLHDIYRDNFQLFIIIMVHRFCHRTLQCSDSFLLFCFQRLAWGNFVTSMMPIARMRVRTMCCFSRLAIGYFSCGTRK